MFVYFDFIEVDVQRRVLTSITNNTQPSAPITPIPMQQGIIPPPQSPQQMIQSPSGMKSPPFSPSRQLVRITIDELNFSKLAINI